MDFFARDYFEACRAPVFAEVDRIIRRWTSADRHTYGLMTDYVSRRAKGLRPGLCIAVCRALGGSLEEVTPSAAVIELFHNAFLIHDDIEDGSEERRGGPALHQSYGTPIALNIGDGLLALSLRPLLENTERLGLSRTLQILEIVVQMVTESFEGQALELRWIEESQWDLDDAHYEEMVRKKTCRYSFVSPAEIGAVVAKADLSIRRKLSGFMYSLGLAFQIQDDLLNLSDDTGAYGTEKNGALWEGKRTLMLLHAIREATAEERAKAQEILGLRRPGGNSQQSAVEQFGAMVESLCCEQIIDRETAQTISTHIEKSNLAKVNQEKQLHDVEYLRHLITKYDGIEYGQKIATKHANDARRQWQTIESEMEQSIHTKFIAGLTDFVVERRH